MCQRSAEPCDDFDMGEDNIILLYYIIRLFEKLLQNTMRYKVFTPACCV